MLKTKNKKGKSSPKGRVRGTRKSAAKPSITRVPGGQFNADAERVTLKHSDQFILVAGASGGTLGTLQFKLNSIFNVNVNSGAGTPQGTTSLGLVYKKVHVYGSRLRWDIRNMQSGGNFGGLGILGVQPTNSELQVACLYPTPTGFMGPTSMTGSSTVKYATKRFDWPRGRPVIAGAYEPTQVNPKEQWRGAHSMTVAKLDGDLDPRQASYVSALGTADPANLCYWNVAFQDVLADATAKGVWLCEVEIYYDCYCFDRVQIVADSLEQKPVRALQLISRDVIKGCEERKDASQVDSDPPSPTVSPAFPDSVAFLPGGYELVKRKPLGALAARR
jgi:hypothetical protein